jgi:hypothetical protein
VNIDAPNPKYNIWIGTSHVFLPTFWCSECDSWSSHHEKLHDGCIRWQTLKNAQMAKQDEYLKQTQKSHYGPPKQQGTAYGRKDNNIGFRILETVTPSKDSTYNVGTDAP